MVKIPLYEYICDDCCLHIEAIEFGKEIDEPHDCPGCDVEMRRAIPLPYFKLKYDPKKDICDWHGNTTQYYRQYKEAKERGENVRIPEMDGERKERNPFLVD